MIPALASYFAPERETPAAGGGRVFSHRCAGKLSTGFNPFLI
jgi:hypothetical protein